MLRALELGDFLTGIPCLRALARAFRDHERILAAPARFSELLCHTGIHRIADTRGLVPLHRDLEGADIAVDLHGRGPESQRILLDSSPGRLISFMHSRVAQTAGSPTWRPDEHEVSRWCRMLRESGIPADPSDLLIGPGPAPADPDRVGATIVHPGAASAARRWPAERFATVARAEAAAGRRVLITGTAPERPLAVRLAEMAGLAPDSVVAGQTSLADLVALIGHASRLICGDTGVAHVASATATPSVVLFGPIPPSEWGPPRSGPHIAIWAGRRGDPHGSHTDPGLLEIDPEQVIEALARLPERSVSPRPGAVGPG